MVTMVQDHPIATVEVHPFHPHTFHPMARMDPISLHHITDVPCPETPWEEVVVAPADVRKVHRESLFWYETFLRTYDRRIYSMPLEKLGKSLMFTFLVIIIRNNRRDLLLWNLRLRIKPRKRGMRWIVLP